MNESLQNRDNANVRRNASGIVCMRGQETIKKEILSETIPDELSKLHKECTYHIHDLEFYGITYNCIGLSVKDMVKEQTIGFECMLRKLYRGIVDLTNRQSGGIGFINFDEDAAAYITDETDEELIKAFRELFCDLNVVSRKGCETPYVTINLGLCTEERGRRVTKAILDAFMAGDETGRPFVFPNIVFKIKSGVNKSVGDLNYDLFEKALGVTAKRMIPTYFNTDASFNRTFEAHKLGIMGCRTRVAANCCGENGALNRGNIASLTINLPQLAYRTNNNIKSFYNELDTVLEDCGRLLLHRYETILNHIDLEWLADKKYYMGNEQYGRNYDNAAMMKNGTLAIGFIGLWDAIGILYGHINEVKDIDAHYSKGFEIVKYMRAFTDRLTKEKGLNFSLLATAAEGTTGRFARYDAQHLGAGYPECAKGYYTNSFHVPVELKVPYWKKTELEGPFHALCNGGSITYMEFEEMPYHNVLAVKMAVESAYAADCSYIGINFPMDICNKCGYTGRLADCCPECGSTAIKRLRRVSGYLAEEKTFADGKKAEMKRRRGHFDKL